jgi:hypothetical protein
LKPAPQRNSAKLSTSPYFPLAKLLAKAAIVFSSKPTSAGLPFVHPCVGHEAA